jgi:hypothetical protein
MPSMAASKLCEQCLGFFANTAATPAFGEGYLIHSSLTTFYDSIHASCHLCTILHYRWKSFLEATRPVANTNGRHLEIHCQPGNEWQKLYFSLASVDTSQVRQPVIEAAATFDLVPAAGKLIKVRHPESDSHCSMYQRIDLGVNEILF